MRDGRTEEFLRLSNIRLQGEMGLLSIVKDPEFVSNNFLYIYYTTWEGIS